MILYNNQFIEREDAWIDIEDRGYQFGDGVYEVIRVYHGQCFAMDEHLDRLKRSAREIKLEWPVSRKELEENIRQLIQKNQLNNGIVYLQITRGPAKRTHQFPMQAKSVLTAYTSEMDRPHNNLQNGINTILADDIRWLRCDIKSLNLLGNVLAKEEAHHQQCYEAILHRQDIVTEGSSSNVFIVRNGKLYTHPANHFILNGITRRYVIRYAKEAKIEVIEKAVPIEEMMQADEVFITSTTSEISPVVKVDHNVIGEGRPGAVTTLLQKKFEEEISQLASRVS
ncbi:D-alanine transaminase [Scopulibacillus daqui]|uniref:D-alanine aminotransferase n=1 Tax=Scopulibacillus daqui TaxID=1469162 RepID=A0ABS2Q060_9BACL|nr:D-amino-acid transaminase [Scopulibacillus daqui]MBM7645210.1 D-alanine transaminase [Scopulibacillus daqui]